MEEDENQGKDEMMISMRIGWEWGENKDEDMSKDEMRM